MRKPVEMLHGRSHCLGPPALSEIDHFEPKIDHFEIKSNQIERTTDWMGFWAEASPSLRAGGPKQWDASQSKRHACFSLWGPLHRLGPEALSNGTVRGAFLQVSVPFSFQSYSFSFSHHVLGLTDLKSNETHRNAKEIFYAFHCA